MTLNLSHFTAQSRMNLLVRNQTDSFLYCPSISPQCIRLLDVRDGCCVCIFPNIRRKNRRDIDSTFGMSVLRFEGIALCVAKPLGSSVVECRHIALDAKTVKANLENVEIEKLATFDKYDFPCTSLWQ